jgi:post-segregation antitoxin (ccd killing protein)
MYWMVARITVTIPDDLHVQLQQVKDEINVSGICQEALSKVVSVEIAKMNATTDREAAIVRLRLEREKSEDKAFSEGKRMALTDAAKMDYESFKCLETLAEEEGSSYPPGWLTEEVRNEPRFSWLFDVARYGKVGPGMEDRFIEGWIEGTLEFWNDVKDEVAISNEVP